MEVCTGNTSQCSARQVLDLIVSNSRSSYQLFDVCVADTNFYFTATDVGSYGREGDCYVFK